MLIDLVDKLVSRVIELLRERKSIRREAFAERVAPIFLDFERIHQDYLSTFRSYRERLDKTDCAMRDIVGEIHEENLFGDHRRSKLRSLVWTTAGDGSDQLLSEFCNSIYRYLTLSHGDLWLAQDDPSFPEFTRGSRNGGIQRWYRQYLMVLESLSATPNQKDAKLWGYWLPIPMLVALEKDLPLPEDYKDRRKVAIDVLDGLVHSMQQEFQWIAQCYASIRNQQWE